MTNSAEQMRVPGTAELERIVRKVLEHDPRLTMHGGRIAVTCEADRSLVLEGEAESVATKKIALELAASVPGSAGIVDRLRVKPSVQMGDGEICDRIRNALIEEPVFARYAIYVGDDTFPKHERKPAAPSGRYVEVAVSDGVVTLNGPVESLSHKRLAGVLAWWVPGTRDVVNGIDVQPPEEDSDDEITDAVRNALEKDKVISSESIRVGTRNAVVTLDGSATNADQAAMAEADAWYVFGVNGVINYMKIIE
jgi:osmotically-inducible protein OsmY